MNEEQLRILRFLENANGPQSSDKIAEQLDLPTGGRTNEHIRDLIRDMVLTKGCLIGSGNRGYYLIRTEEELEKNRDSLINRGDETYNRAEALERNWNNQQNPN